jgi:hypothetical protein
VRLETTREVGVIFACHLVGPALGVDEVHHGSWAYPQDAYSKAGGVGASWLVATMKATEGRLYGGHNTLPSVVTTAAGAAPDTPPETDPVRSQACSTSSEAVPGTHDRPGS